MRVHLSLIHIFIHQRSLLCEYNLYRKKEKNIVNAYNERYKDDLFVTLKYNLRNEFRNTTLREMLAPMN